MTPTTPTDPTETLDRLNRELSEAIWEAPTLAGLADTVDAYRAQLAAVESAIDVPPFAEAIQTPETRARSLAMAIRAANRHALAAIASVTLPEAA